MVFAGGYEIGGSLAIVPELNRYFISHNDVTNLNFQLFVTRRFGRGSNAP